MSIRANRLQSVVLDSIYFAALTAIVGTTLTTIARGQEPQVVQTADAANDRRLTDDHIDSQLNTDDNMPSGDPAESPEAKREAMMLGMKLFERRQGYIHVADVAATSPAWDAGIRPGDRLMSIDNLKPRSLAPWVDDVSKVLKDTPDGKSVSASVERDGETLALRVRLPVSKAAEVRDARQEEQAIANMAGGNPQQPLQQQGMQTAPVGSGGDNTGFVPTGGGGVVGFGVGGFDDGSTNSTGINDDRLAQRAMAQLMPVSSIARGTVEEQAAQQQNPRGGGGQVGVATFEDNGQGVSAVVLVRGLPQGTYRVGIGQGDGMTGGIGGTNFGDGTVGDGSTGDESFGDGVSNQFNGRDRNQFNRNNNRNDSRVRNLKADGVDQMPNQGQFPNQQLPMGGNPQDPSSAPQQPGLIQPGAGGTGSGSATGGGAGVGTGGGSATGGASSGAGGASLADPNGAGVLAQQLDTNRIQSPNQGNRRMLGNNSQGVGPGNSHLPNSGGNGRITPSAGNATQQSGVNDNLNGANNGLNNTGGFSPFVAEIGVLQVGANGSARVENQLEGMQVRNLAGMSVTVVSEMSQFGAGTGSQNPVNPQNATGQSQTGQVQSGNGRFPDNRPIQSGQNGSSPGSQGVVATGVIQITEGRLPNTGHDSRNGVPDDNRPVDPATQEQRNRNQISDPQRDFDPSTSQQ